MVNPNDAELFFQRFDSDQDGKLGYWEFCNSLLPLEIRMRDEIENRSAYELTFETRNCLKRCLRRCIDTEVQIERIR